MQFIPLIMALIPDDNAPGFNRSGLSDSSLNNLYTAAAVGAIGGVGVGCVIGLAPTTIVGLGCISAASLAANKHLG